MFFFIHFPRPSFPCFIFHALIFVLTLSNESDETSFANADEATRDQATRTTLAKLAKPIILNEFFIIYNIMSKKGVTSTCEHEHYTYQPYHNLTQPFLVHQM